MVRIKGSILKVVFFIVFRFLRSQTVALGVRCVLCPPPALPSHLEPEIYVVGSHVFYATTAADFTDVLAFGVFAAVVTEQPFQQLFFDSQVEIDVL